MKSKIETEEIISQAIAADGYELIDLIIQNQGSKKLLQFFVDKNGGLTLNDCEILTRKIDAVLTMENIIEGAYILEVSSPGMNRVLKKPEHFKKFLGERAKITLKQALENRANFTGLIETADDDKMVLSDGTNKFTFKYEDIKKAHLDPVTEF
jgi:ribosome maturation factor RimP